MATLPAAAYKPPIEGRRTRTALNLFSNLLARPVDSRLQPVGTKPL